MDRKSEACDKAPGKLYIIGTGPAGPQMETLQALKTIKKADVILAPKKHAMFYMKYIGLKPVLFNPWEGFFLKYLNPK